MEEKDSKEPWGQIYLVLKHKEVKWGNEKQLETRQKDRESMTETHKQERESWFS